MTRAEALHSALERTMRVAPGMATRYVLDAAREMAVAENRPIMVIASRRQVDCPSAGGGYLGWDTAEWCRAASHQNGAAPLLLLGRDHGGPYQHPRDLQTDAEPAAAMAFAKESLRHDIECGLSLIHIDGSLGRRGVEELPEVALGRTLELVSFCVDVADGANRNVAFEVGLETQNEHIVDHGSCERYLATLFSAVERQCGVVPAFVVAQTGTKVSGSRNTGAVSGRCGRVESERLRAIGLLCRGHGSRLKAHNSDYLDPSGIAALHAADAWMNVSPQLGLEQTRSIVRVARSAGLHRCVDAFAQAAIDAGHWRKWAPPGEHPVDAEKVLLGGSYVFTGAEFGELRARLDRELRGSNATTDRIATDAVKSVLYRYRSRSLV